MNRLTTSRGDLDLTRFPEDPRDQLRAWDAADEYLLRHLADPTGSADVGSDADAAPVDLSGTVVVVGDRWGALTTALAQDSPTQISDSYLAQQATRANLERNGYNGHGAASVTLASTLDAPPERIDVLLVRVPKNLALLEDQLHRLAPSIHAGTVIVGTGMVTEIHTSTLRLFEQILGPTRTSLAEKKARLIFCSPDTGIPHTPSPWPRSYALPPDIDAASGRTVTNYAGTFSAEHLDIGTRFLLQHLPSRRGALHIVDLGCGNGVIGLAAALSNPEAALTFVDESFHAVASAEATFRQNMPPDRIADFRAGDGLTGFPTGSADLVLNNPPFHTHQATTDATAWRMFSDSHTALKPGGELWVVGNRHLGYHVKLKRLFGNCETVAANPKFVVLRAVRR